MVLYSDATVKTSKSTQKQLVLGCIEFLNSKFADYAYSYDNSR